MIGKIYSPAEVESPAASLGWMSCVLLTVEINRSCVYSNSKLYKLHSFITVNNLLQISKPDMPDITCF